MVANPCSCEDNAEGRKICKHIHAVQIFMKKTSQPTKHTVPAEEIELMQDTVCESMSSASLVENFIKQVEDKTITDFLPKVRNTKDLQILKSVQSHLLKAVAIMDAAKYISVSSNPLPLDVSTATEQVTKNIIKQDRLYSTMKKKKIK